jgi:alkanesulfonate monooxygenase SsuD/methylene tetrahydromethanopterin reductase-like flavin-dependent oxidoreductase (luciferase family)
MEFGIQFFPAVGPHQKPADHYWREALELTQLAEQLGFTNVRTVEHYFLSYGGYSPDPLIFLSAAAALTRSMRLITGAVLPVFNNPLKLAGQIGMVDAISGGRLEVGFARAFLPHEFARFGISMDESRARFEEGLEQVRRLLEEEKVTARGRFHSFEDATSLPRPTPSRGHHSGSRRCPRKRRSRPRVPSAITSWASRSEVRIWQTCCKRTAMPGQGRDTRDAGR